MELYLYSHMRLHGVDRENFPLSKNHLKVHAFWDTILCRFLVTDVSDDLAASIFRLYSIVLRYYSTQHVKSNMLRVIN